MEFGASRVALMWVVPANYTESDLQRFVEWLQVMMANIEEIDALEVDLDAISVEPDSDLWRAVVGEGEKFGLKIKRIFKVGNGTIKLTFSERERRAL